ncbi:uncharacterized protein LOC123524320 [Mercenaria mercenaria]|uniref:uncharacterized protein LOC123524320 n=1 Tax=Mercenaria mercenaria TaxID=6596 RepID=UPI00234F54DB|nr:uncharacterized protein LOC123524320 [Mercenaria mercenaria]
MYKSNLGDDILRIYICGPHSTGKTTLLKDLRPHIGNIKIVEEVARGIIKNHGWTRDDFLPEKHPDVFQQLNEEVLAAQIETDKKYTRLGQDFICDRALDPMIYCGFYIGEQAKEAMYRLDGMERWLESLRKSLVVLVSPHPECIHDDSVRLSSSIEELREFYAKFEKELQHNHIRHVKLTQLDRQERVHTVLKELTTFKRRKSLKPAEDGSNAVE